MEYKALELWDKVFATDKRTTKEVRSGGRRFTAIDAYSQLRKATELWGPYGSSWGLQAVEHTEIQIAENRMLVKTTACFYYPQGEFCQTVSGWLMTVVKAGKPDQYTSYDNEIYKKNETDLLTKCLSKLGFNADVFMGAFDGNPYAQELAKEAKQANPKLLPDSVVKRALVNIKSKGENWQNTLQVVRGYAEKKNLIIKESQTLEITNALQDNI